MGLVRAGSAADLPPGPTAEDAEMNRRKAAQELGQTPGAEAELGRWLRAETDPAVRAALFRSLAAQGSVAAAEVLIEALKAEDAALRNGALETLVQMPGPAAQVLDRLLAAPDPGLRMFGALLAGDLPLSGVELHLFAQLSQETDVNVCATLLEVVLGAGQPLPSVLALDLGQRFRADPFVQFLLEDADRLDRAVTPRLA